MAISLEELQLAARNHALPLEAVRHDITPVGLHYVLTHYDIPLVDPAQWSLAVGGLVERPLTLTLAELRRRAAVETTATMECAGNGRARIDPHVVSQPWLVEAVGTARWRGVPLRALLDEAGLQPEATEVVFTGIDRGVEGGEEQAFARSLLRDEALAADALLAYEMNGAPLPVQHGFPLRLVVPGWYGMANVKWLARIEAVGAPFAGYQQARGYRIRLSEEEDGEPLTRMAPRSLLVPPGIPEFLTRERLVETGACALDGRAWSGHAPVARVEVSTDGGETWGDAVLEPRDPDAPFAWRRWTFAWAAPAGDAVLGSRAFDEAGNGQPLEPAWNVGGYGNNAVQWVRVRVR